MKKNRDQYNFFAMNILREVNPKMSPLSESSALNSFMNLLEQSNLSEIQKNRLLQYASGKTYQEIADEEGRDFSTIYKSVQSSIDALKAVNESNFHARNLALENNVNGGGRLHSENSKSSSTPDLLREFLGKEVPMSEFDMWEQRRLKRESIRTYYDLVLKIIDGGFLPNDPKYVVCSRILSKAFSHLKKYLYDNKN